MPDEHTLNDFERRLADELARHAAVATDPRSTRSVAAEAMRLGHRRRLVRSWPRGRVMALAAAILVPLAVAAALVGAPPAPTPTADGNLAVVLRQAGTDMDVVLVDTHGRERLLRHLTAEALGLGTDHQLSEYGSVSPNGWLYISAASTLTPHYTQTRDALVDLADPGNQPTVVPYSGYVGARWASDGRAALVCGPPPDCGQTPQTQGDLTHAVVRVVDPEAGSEVIVHDVQEFGGNPALIWAADGSGFLHSDPQGWGVQPLDGGPVERTTPAIVSRWSRLVPPVGSAMPQVTDAYTVGQQWLGDLLVPAVPVSANNAADGDAIWMVLDEIHGSQHQAVVAKLIGPGRIASVHRFDVPKAVVGLAMSDDDAVVALYPDFETFVLARVGDPASSPTVSHPIDGTLAGFVAAGIANGWPSE